LTEASSTQSVDNPHGTANGRTQALSIVVSNAAARKPHVG
jgi:hypothetical protein